MLVERVRYGARKNRTIYTGESFSKITEKAIRGCPKNTLVTVKDGPTIFFGIARCNRSVGEVFTKAMGKHIARQRAHLAQRERSIVPVNAFVVHESGLRGSVPADQVHTLLQYFDDVDRNIVTGEYLRFEYFGRINRLAGLENAQEEVDEIPENMTEPERFQTLAGLRENS